MIPLARSVTSSRSSVHAPVERYFQPPSAETTTIEADSSSPSDAAHFDRSGQGGPGRDPGEDPNLGQTAGPFDRLAGTHDRLAIEQVSAAQILEDGRYVPVVEVAQAVDHLARRRLHRPDGDVVAQLLPQEAADTEQRPRCAEPGHEVSDRGAVPEDLGAGALVVGPRIGRVGVLIQEDPLGMLLGEATGHAHGTIGCLRAGRLDDLRAPQLQQLAPFHRDVGRHHRLEVIALHSADHGQPDAGVTRGRLHQDLVRLARSQHAPSLGVLDQRQRHPVLHRAPGFCPSSLMAIRARGLGLSALMSTSGVLPIMSSTEA